MKHDFAFSGAHNAARRAFATLDALRLVPPPLNQSVEDLNRHVRTVIFKRPRPLIVQLCDRRAA